MDLEAPARRIAAAVKEAGGRALCVGGFVRSHPGARLETCQYRILRETFLKQLQPIIEIVPVIQVVRACRDPRDDMFLEAAVNGRADVIVTRDKDLLALHPFAGIAIVTPSNYLTMVEPESE